MAEPNPRELTTCPYNPSHQVDHFRMHIHLQKCRKQYPNSGKAVCPFDAAHIVNDVELDYHVTSCPKRHMLDRQLYAVGDECTFGPRVKLPAPPPPDNHCDENWDDDEFHEGYKPDAAKKGAHVIQKIKGATPSERRKARMEGIKNFRPLE